MNEACDGLLVERAEAAILPLVKRFFSAQGMRAQAAKDDEVYIVRKGQPIIAALRLCPEADSAKSYWFLRSMCVDTSLQRRGIGHYFLKSIRDEFGNKLCYCFPYEYLESFYAECGFIRCDEDNAPETLKQKYQQYREAGKKIIIMRYGEENS